MKTDANCIFCKIVAGQMPCFKLLEDDATLAIMDIYPASDGHLLVLSKEHFPTVFDVSEEAFAAVSYSVNRVARAGEPDTTAAWIEPSPGEWTRCQAVGATFSYSCATAQTRRRAKANQKHLKFLIFCFCGGQTAACCHWSARWNKLPHRHNSPNYQSRASLSVG